MNEPKSISELGQDLDLNERINLRGLVEAWLRINVERFQEGLTQKLYRRQRSSRKRRLSRTYQLLRNWRSSISGAGEDVAGAQYSFLEYGRFMDMGVGGKTSYALSKYQSIRRNGEKRSRKPVRWYSRRKGYEIHRLRELLCEHYVSVPIEFLENTLTARVEVGV